MPNYATCLCRLSKKDQQQPENAAFWGEAAPQLQKTKPETKKNGAYLRLRVSSMIPRPPYPPTSAALVSAFHHS